MIVHNATVADLRVATDRVLAIRRAAGSAHVPARKGFGHWLRRAR